MSDKLKQLLIEYKFLKYEFNSTYGLNMINIKTNDILINKRNEIREEYKRIKRTAKLKILLDE